MIFTIGHFNNYAHNWEAYGEVWKVGRYTDMEGPNVPRNYPGGCVWQTFDEAAQYLQDNDMAEYAVWPVSADWIKDTTPNNEGAPWSDLLVDSRLLPYSEKPCSN